MRPLSEILPKELTALNLRPLMTLLVEVLPPIVVGNTPGIDRRIGVLSGGHFEGERLNGTVLPGGSDWQTVRPGDGAWMLNVRTVLKTDDGELIGLLYQGLRHGPKDVLARIGRGEAVSPTEYYLRMTAQFETASPKYDWINRIIGIGTGHRLPEGGLYQIFELL